ncbi:alpha-mannosidase, partial [Candidatus Bipolaricaulota bacterium]|nr:alpha-mannosidase [Candidatus Bipolaricaulota bacterium]
EEKRLYEFIRKHYPDLFERLSDAIEEGKWEPVGGTWVESDVNLSGGEPLARQYLYGKRYFRQHFDVDPKITFLPDAFGFSAALPGIAQAAGCPYLFTHKLSWNEVNEFPHHSFNWEGIDGSRLLTHFPPADTYNGMSLEKGIDEVTQSARGYKEKEKHQEAAYLIGWGDGGGGPNRDMIEDVKNIREMGSLPDIEFDSLKNFFTRLKEEGEQFEDWYGELYLERHRGTFTTQSKVKRKNRELEFLLRESEFWSALAAVRQKGFEYPKDQLEDTWKSYLFNQFHDILPGSSIREVYVDAERDYEEVESISKELLNEAKNHILPTEPDTQYFFVGNSLSWKTDRVVSTEVKGELGDDIYVETEDGAKLPGQISHDGKAVFSATELPGLGGKTFKIKEGTSPAKNGIEVTSNKLENERIKVTLDERGEISSIFDKEAEREVVTGRANQLVAYTDIPTEFEAWELEEDIYENSEPVPAPDRNRMLESGPVRGILEQKRSYGNSLINQRITIFRNSKRLDFKTEVDWHEEKVLLKSHFPVNVQAHEATYEVQFGHFNRATHENTTWDEARFEVPHQKWVDVSEYGFGAALLNNGKYGVNVDKSRIGLSLLRAPKWPDPEADMGHHEFAYSFLPHSGDFRQAGVIEEAYDFNIPTETTQVNRFMEVPPLIETSDRGVVVESIKLSQDSDRRLVVRLYEAWGRNSKSRIDLGFQAEKVVTLNLIEDELEELDLSGGKLKYDFDPFEIVTLGVDF